MHPPRTDWALKAELRIFLSSGTGGQKALRLSQSPEGVTNVLRTFFKERGFPQKARMELPSGEERAAAGNDSDCRCPNDHSKDPIKYVV